MLKKLLGLILSVCMLLSCGLAAAAPASALFGNARYLICIHKQSYRLDVYQQGVEEAVCSYPIAVAKNPGDKQYTCLLYTSTPIEVSSAVLEVL